MLQAPSDFVSLVGTELGTSDWIQIDQDRIDAFAKCTGDHFWIHVDEARAQREMPGGKTIAHGLMLLAMVPMLQREIFRVERRGIGLNYGSDRVRYTAPVPVGSRVRLRQKVLAATAAGDGTRLTTECIMELEGSEKPAFVANFIIIIGA